MLKELKRKVLSEEKNYSVLALLAEGYSGCQVALILEMSKKHHIMQQKLETTKKVKALH